MMKAINAYKNHFGMVTATVIAICLSALMALVAIFVDKLSFNICFYIKNWGACFLIITVTSWIFPMTKWSFALAKKLKLKPGSIGHQLIENTIASLIFNTTATLGLAALNIFYNADIEAAVAAGAAPSVATMYWSTVLHDWPIMFVISFVAAWFITKLAISIAKSATLSDMRVKAEKSMDEHPEMPIGARPGTAQPTSLPKDIEQFSEVQE